MISSHSKLKPSQDPKLKKQQQEQAQAKAELRNQTKELLMEFHSYTKEELLYILELCEYELELAQHYLRVTSKTKVRLTLKDFLAGKIASGIESLGLKPGKIPMKKATVEIVIPEEQKEEVKEEEWVPTGPNLFETMATGELCHYILDFLDPISLGKAGFTCKKFYEISLHPLLFKKFCLKLYSQQPPLPVNTPLNGLVDRLNAAPRNEYHPRIIAEANKDIRSLVWNPSVKVFHTPNNYYKKFKTFRDIYMDAPRIKFGGVYMMKERYIRAGTKELNRFYDPYHTIEFFRYFRFHPDGYVKSSLSVNKLKKDKLINCFSVESQGVEEDEMLTQNSMIKSALQGEYILQMNKVHVRLIAKTTIYEFELEVEPSAPGCFDHLKMVSQKMRFVDSEDSEPLKNEYMGSKLFKFVPVQELYDELDPSVKSYAL